MQWRFSGDSPMIDLFGLEQTNKRSNDRTQAAASKGTTCQNCIHRVDVTLWGCWLVTGCQLKLVMCQGCTRRTPKELRRVLS